MSGHRICWIDVTGPRSGNAPLTWGQRAIWDPIQWYAPDDHVFNFRRIVEVPAHVTVEQVLDTVAALLAGHEALRTTFGWNDDDEPVQRLPSQCRLGVQVVDSPDSLRVAESTRDQLAGQRFAEGDLPVRLAVVTADQVPRYAVLVVSHLAVDGWSFSLLADEFARFRPAESAVAPRGYQPLDLAAVEASEVGQALDRDAAAHWHKQLARAARTTTPGPPMTSRDDYVPRWWRGQLDSPALRVASDAIAGRMGVSSSAVLLAATGRLLATHLRVASHPLLVVLSNRNDDVLGGTIGTITQDGLVVLEVGDQSFANLVARAAAELEEAHRYGRYDPRTRARATADVGGLPDLTYYFNDCRFDAETRIGRPVTVSRESLDALVSESLFSWEEGSANEDSTFFLDIESLGGALRLSLLADTVTFAPEEIENTLRAMESLVIGAVTGD